MEEDIVLRKFRLGFDISDALHVKCPKCKSVNGIGQEKQVYLIVSWINPTIHFKHSCNNLECMYTWEVDRCNYGCFKILNYRP